MEKTKVYLNNMTKAVDGVSNSNFPNDGTSISVTGKKRILIYSVSSSGLLEVVFNNSVETSVIQGENNSIDIPENCQGISFRLSDEEYANAKFVFEII